MGDGQDKVKTDNSRKQWTKLPSVNKVSFLINPSFDSAKLKRLQRNSYDQRTFKGGLPDPKKKSQVSVISAGQTAKNTAGHKYTAYDIDTSDREQLSQSLPDNNTQEPVDAPRLAISAPKERLSKKTKVFVNVKPRINNLVSGQYNPEEKTKGRSITKNGIEDKQRKFTETVAPEMRYETPKPPLSQSKDSKMKPEKGFVFHAKTSHSTAPTVPEKEKPKVVVKLPKPMSRDASIVKEEEFSQKDAIERSQTMVYEHKKRIPTARLKTAIKRSKTLLNFREFWKQVAMKTKKENKILPYTATDAADIYLAALEAATTKLMREDESNKQDILPYEDPLRTVPPWHRKEYVLNEREIDMYNHLKVIYGDKTTMLKRCRQQEFYEKLEKLQQEETKKYNSLLKDKKKQREKSKLKQQQQLKFVRNKFEEEQVNRFRNQYVTTRILQHEWTTRHIYGLPEDLGDDTATSRVKRKVERAKEIPDDLREQNIRRFRGLFDVHCGLALANMKPPKFGKKSKKLPTDDVVRDARKMLDETSEDEDSTDNEDESYSNGADNKLTANRSYSNKKYSKNPSRQTYLSPYYSTLRKPQSRRMTESLDKENKKPKKTIETKPKFKLDMKSNANNYKKSFKPINDLTKIEVSNSSNKAPDKKKNVKFVKPNTHSNQRINNRGKISERSKMKDQNNSPSDEDSKVEENNESTENTKTADSRQLTPELKQDIAQGHDPTPVQSASTLRGELNTNETKVESIPYISETSSASPASNVIQNESPPTNEQQQKNEEIDPNQLDRNATEANNLSYSDPKEGSAKSKRENSEEKSEQENNSENTASEGNSLFNSKSPKGENKIPETEKSSNQNPNPDTTDQSVTQAEADNEEKSTPTEEYTNTNDEKFEKEVLRPTSSHSKDQESYKEQPIIADKTGEPFERQSNKLSLKEPIEKPDEYPESQETDDLKKKDLKSAAIKPKKEKKNISSADSRKPKKNSEKVKKEEKSPTKLPDKKQNETKGLTKNMNAHDPKPSLSSKEKHKFQKPANSSHQERTKDSKLKKLPSRENTKEPIILPKKDMDGDRVELDSLDLGYSDEETEDIFERAKKKYGIQIDSDDD
ncbi:DgyrCDS2298 [Dimorphilus gyrociliatus]|uniref:DgyrCDS2298 n=1 Tax=Dimorphilus gyrociliatus TaxID=2664684 RepID=A0A7I8V9U8_9ANNE|nr:DgyrCDS2298 [Dimorphilus gyrociliatus]